MMAVRLLVALLLLIGVAHAQAQSGSGPLNLYGLNDYGQGSNMSGSGRTLVSNPTPGPTVGVFIVLGQSLAANYGVSLYTPTNATACLNLNIWDGNIYQLVDPVLGTNGTLGSYIGRLCDKLINAGKYSKVIMIPGAVGGTTIGEWTTGGDPLFQSFGWFSHRLVVCIKRAQQLGYAVNGILWDQGNADNAEGTTESNYIARFNNLVATAAAAGFNGKWLVAIETMNLFETSAPIHAAQGAVVNGTNILQGANTDGLGTGSNRQSDGAHLTDAGNDADAALWATIIESNF